MPQMSPILWSINMMYFLMIFYLFIYYTYFNFFKTLSNYNYKNKKKINFKWNW